MARLQGLPAPWTHDPILANHRFTNTFRASDRTSQYLIAEVLYQGSQLPSEVVFRTLLFKLFNRVSTWEHISRVVGFPTWREFSLDTYSRVLDALQASGNTIYSAAYLMPSPPFGASRKHRNHLALIQHIMLDGAPQRIATSPSLESVYATLRSYPSLGDFLAYQIAIDLNYSSILHFSEMDFVVAGPGARDGIQKCFQSTAGFSDADVVRLVTERAPYEFARLSLTFQSLWGRSLQLIDCQNVFCEVSKYARVAHPEITGRLHRFRIKQKYSPSEGPLPQLYPPRWALEIPSALRWRREGTTSPTGSAPNQRDTYGVAAD